MTPASPTFELTLHFGTLERRVPLIALAAALRLPRDTLQQALTGLLFAYSAEPSEFSHEGEPTEGEKRSFPFNTYMDPTLRSFGEGKGARGEGNPKLMTLTAEALAHALDDEPNLPALRLLVTQHSSTALSAALTETLAVPLTRIRKSRGAYFTAAVRRLSSGSVSRPSSITPYV